MITNDFVNNYFKQHQLKLVQFDERPWGGWYIFDVGSNYDRKVLWVKPHQFLSLQFHGTLEHKPHSEYWQAITNARVLVGHNSVVGATSGQLDQAIRTLQMYDLRPGKTLRIAAGALHALVNPFDTDVYIEERRVSPVGESPADREGNITRIYDQSGRPGTQPWPEWLVQKIYSGLKRPR